MPNTPELATPTTTPTTTLPTSVPTSTAALLEQQRGYEDLRRNVALGMLFVCPALMLLPPRKADAYTFGLGFAWVFCANEVVKNKTGGADLLTYIATAGKARGPDYAEKVAAMKKGWLGEDVRQEMARDEGEEEGIYERIVGSVWDVWQQRGKKGGVSREEEEELEDVSLRERVEAKRRELAERK